MVRSLIGLVLMAGLSVARAQEGGHQLVGAVHDAEGQPVVGAWVDLRPLKNGAISAATYAEAPFQALRSGPDGRWAFAGLADGAWLLTAVTTTEPVAVPLTDEELQKLMLPGPDYRMPEGVALSRSIHYFESGEGPTKKAMDVGLALGPRPQRPLLGQLVGAYAPDKSGFEVTLTRSSPSGGTFVVETVTVGGGAVSSTTTLTEESTSAPGTTTTTESKIVDGVSDPPAPLFTVLPDHDGFFDFGSLDVKEADWVSVQSVPVSAVAGGIVGDPFDAPMGVFEPWEIGIEIPLPVVRSITLKAVSAEGGPVSPAADEHIEYTVWNTAWGGVGMEMFGGGPSALHVLKEGTYLVRATLGDFASPLTAFQVEASGGPTEIPLALQACPLFTVQFVDAKGAPLGDYTIKLGTAASKVFPQPCRVDVFGEDGKVELKGFLPGTYEVEFSHFGEDAFIRTLELKPDGGPVAVTTP